MYVDPDQQTLQQIMRWSPPQLPNLRAAALVLLQALAPAMTDVRTLYLARTPMKHTPYVPYIFATLHLGIAFRKHVLHVLDLFANLFLA
jgi:hypothetical protein